MKASPLVLLLFLFSNLVFPESKPVLLIPKPDSKFNKVSTSISIRFNQKSASDFINEKSVFIIGSKSGIHEFSSKLSDDGYSVILYPLTKFSNDETVTVKTNTNKSKSEDDLKFTFETEKQTLTADALQYYNNELRSNRPSDSQNRLDVNRTPDAPLSMPQITILNSVAPSAGNMFISSFPVLPVPTEPYLMVLDNSATPVFSRQMPALCLDFKRQPNGNMTYYDGQRGKFFEMNASYEIIDSFYCGNGYSTDLHEIRFIDNGSHVLLMSYDPQPVNMRHIITNGDSTAIVTGLIIQEIDRNRNVIFQWRSWDHFEIIDAVHENLTAHQIDYVHGNALEIDTDGNILVSCRHLEEITKINRSNGEIIWRLGGRHNQFTALTDSVKFSYQHAVRRLPNGNITIFDNGDFRDTNITRDPVNNPDNSTNLFSRAAEFKLDEVNHTVKLVWQYINDITNSYAYAMGYVQRLSNGNTIIGWGTGYPTLTEVTPQRTKVFELALPMGINSYRAYRDDIATSNNSNSSENATPSKFELYQNYPNPFNPVTKIKFDIANQSNVVLTIFNLIGQKIAEENYGLKQPGSYEYNWNASNLSSGIYFYKIETNSFTETKKMMLLK